MTPDTKGIEALLSALNRSAERLQGLWFSFMAISLYLTITALTTTHRMLLLEEPQVLPIINLKVPLLAFYIITPIIYIVLHFYFLMMLVLLARSADEFDKALKSTLFVEQDRELFRMRAENTLFLQLLIGSLEERQGINGRLLDLIAIITLALAPILTLVSMQLQFLPYHHLAITWLHRVAVVVDLFLILFLWRGYRFRRGKIIPSGPKRAWAKRQAGWIYRSVVFTIGCAVPLWLTFWEGRWAGEPFLNPIPERKVEWNSENNIYQGDINNETIYSRLQIFYLDFIESDKRLLISLGIFDDHIELINEQIISDETFVKKIMEKVNAFDDLEQRYSDAGQPFPYTISFAGRNLAYANFTGSDLRGVNFQNFEHDKWDSRDAVVTVIDGVDFRRTRLDYTFFSGSSNAQNVNFEGSKILYANLSFSTFTNANFADTEIYRSNFYQSKFINSAVFVGSSIKSSNFSEARMIGADFERASVYGSDFSSADLSAAQFLYSNIYFSKMISSDLLGVSFASSIFFANDFNSAFMVGSSFDTSQFSVTDFRNAQILGADLVGAEFSYSLFTDANFGARSCDFDFGYDINTDDQLFEDVVYGTNIRIEINDEYISTLIDKLNRILRSTYYFSSSSEDRSRAIDKTIGRLRILANKIQTKKTCKSDHKKKPHKPNDVMRESVIQIHNYICSTEIYDDKDIPLSVVHDIDVNISMENEYSIYFVGLPQSMNILSTIVGSRDVSWNCPFVSTLTENEWNYVNNTYKRLREISEVNYMAEDSYMGPPPLTPPSTAPQTPPPLPSALPTLPTAPPTSP